MIMKTVSVNVRFKNQLIKVLEPGLLERGYKRVEFSTHKGYFQYGKLINNHGITIYFDIKSRDQYLYINISNAVKGGRDIYNIPPYFAEEEGVIHHANTAWDFSTDEMAEEKIQILKRIIFEKAIPWAEKDMDIKIDYDKLIKSHLSPKLKKLGFDQYNYKNNKKYIYASHRRKIDNILKIILFTFIKLSKYGFDVVRFELDDPNLVCFCRLIFFPETSKMKCKFLDEFNSKTKTYFSDETTFKELLEDNLEQIKTYAHDWFEQNRPKSKPKTDNMGLFPDMEKLKKEYEEKKQRKKKKY